MLPGLETDHVFLLFGLEVVDGFAEDVGFAFDEVLEVGEVLLVEFALDFEEFAQLLLVRQDVLVRLAHP